MKEFNYKQVAKQIGWNFSQANYTVEYPSNYNYYKEVTKHITPNTVMLDIGCGSAEKSTRYYSLAKKIYLTDFEPEMLKKAKANANKYYEQNSKQKNRFYFKILDCNGPFNFADNSFDLVVSRHCGANMQEVYRVLKKGGVFVSEDYSADDCQELKDIFKRGQDYNQAPLYKKVMQDCLTAGFSKIEFLKFEEIEHYKTAEDLKFLLHNTPILNGFDEEVDNIKLQEYINLFSTKKGIKLNRKLYAYTVTK
ncbi:MAG: class I SAM-dependent methyltransferase [Clostridia bacterium]|nr:class I SAM-dependent methyltransferase [Clostridia bacterium]